MPGGIDQYVTELADPEAPTANALPAAGTVQPAARATKAGAVLRATRKEVQRLERELERAGAREQELQEMMAASATDHSRLTELTAELGALSAERERLETAWLEAAETLEA